tara:strand:- start:8839 stop:9831 length:993 start_codon:yes stop_codon:yes gene_type:complete
MLVSIQLHRDLGEAIGKEWNLAVTSVAEALGAIEILSKEKLFSYLSSKNKVGKYYQILVNKRPIDASNITEDLESIKESDLTINRGNLKSIDIIPVIEGADTDIIGVVLGIALIATGLGAFAGLGFTLGSGLSAGLIIGGIGLVAGGVIGLLSKPPEFGDFGEFESGGQGSYLFNGPVNTIREGGPVPVGYGRLLVGSQTISSSLVSKDITSDAFTDTEESSFQEDLGGFLIRPVQDLIVGSSVGIGIPVFSMGLYAVIGPKWQNATGIGTWEISEGALPPGITILTATGARFINGALVGIPTTAGTYKFTVKTTQGLIIATRQYTMTIT